MWIKLRKRKQEQPPKTDEQEEKSGKKDNKSISLTDEGAKKPLFPSIRKFRQSIVPFSRNKPKDED